MTFSVTANNTLIQKNFMISENLLLLQKDLSKNFALFS